MTTAYLRRKNQPHGRGANRCFVQVGYASFGSWFWVTYFITYTCRRQCTYMYLRSITC